MSTEVTNRRVVAWVVHAYTAAGSVLAFLMIAATIAGDYRQTFLWMATATLIDATDGWLARKVGVREVLPWFNGARLDDIVDYLTFVFAPAVLIQHAGLVTGWLGYVAIGAVLMSSAYGFSREDSKTADHFFTGFPSYWNVVAFYLYASGLSPETNAGVLLTLAALVFAPIAYVYPTRTPQMRRTTLAFGMGWGLLLIWLVVQGPPELRRWLAISLVYPIYYVAVSLVLSRRRHRPGESAA
jgi:phosphatidylcholine synthase